MKISAGILPYKIKDNQIYFLLGHLGGFFWKNKKRSWTILKGEIKKDEDIKDGALREFYEESGIKITSPLKYLGEFKINNKINHIFLTNSNIDPLLFNPQSFVEISFKNKKYIFPEIDNIKWFSIKEAKEHIISSFEPILEEAKKEIFNEK